MNKCILFSLGLGLARAGASNEKRKNCKQMVKSNKKDRRRGQAERLSYRMEEQERVWRNKNEKKNPSILAAFLLLFFFLNCKANREKERKYKGMCSHFLSESPTRTTETFLISPVQLYLCAQSFQNSNITPRDAVCLSAACLMESQKLTPFHCS